MNTLDSLSKKIVDIKMVVQENLWVQKNVVKQLNWIKKMLVFENLGIESFG